MQHPTLCLLFFAGVLTAGAAGTARAAATAASVVTGAAANTASAAGTVTAADFGMQAAQNPSSQAPSPQAVQEITLTASVADSVPQTAVEPVQRQPAQAVERTTFYGEPPRDLSRTERRAWRAKAYAAKIDSIVRSRNYLFFPNSMQELPGGLIRSIYADYFFFGMFVDHVEVHLPTERGITQYVEMLNFESMSIHDYRAARVQWGWSVSFNITDGDALYHADFAISTATGETVLTLITPILTMRYVGWLWNKRVDDPRYHRLD